MPLTDQACKKARPADKPYKLADEKGLYLLINAAGKYWRMDYRFAAKRKWWGDDPSIRQYADPRTICPVFGFYVATLRHGKRGGRHPHGSALVH